MMPCINLEAFIRANQFVCVLPYKLEGIRWLFSAAVYSLFIVAFVVCRGLVFVMLCSTVYYF